MDLARYLEGRLKLKLGVKNGLSLPRVVFVRGKINALVGTTGCPQSIAEIIKENGRYKLAHNE